VWFGIRTSNGRKWRKSIPLADNKHCYVVVVVYLLLSEDDSAILTGFQWYNFEKKIFEHTFQNHHFRPLKIRGFGLGRTRKKFADSDANSESVTTLIISEVMHQQADNELHNCDERYFMKWLVLKSSKSHLL